MHIEIEDLSFALGGHQILNRVSLNVEAGEYVSVIGPNGAGKSTMLKCLDRIWTGAQGNIRILGRPLDDYSQRRLAKTLAYVPQDTGKALPFSVYDMVLMGRYPYLSPFSSVRPEDEEAVTAALALTGTEHLARRPHRTLSGGERQKVHLAAALAQDARILLLDEPTTFLDPHHQADIFRILGHINRESGVTILAVTHDINSAVLASNRILALKAGQVSFCGPSSQVMDNRVLGELYGKEFLFVEHPVTGQRLVVPEGMP